MNDHHLSSNALRELTIARIARALFVFSDLEKNPKELHSFDDLWQGFDKVLSNTEKTTRLHPDFSHNFSIWITLKSEALDAKEKGQKPNLPVPLELYRKNVLEMIEDLEKRTH